MLKTYGGKGTRPYKWQLIICEMQGVDLLKTLPIIKCTVHCGLKPVVHNTQKLKYTTLIIACDFLTHADLLFAYYIFMICYIMLDPIGRRTIYFSLDSETEI